MSDNTKIEWCDASWPVIRGCSKCSPGCEFCWAITDAHLHAGSPNAKAAAHFAGLTQITNGRPNWTGKVRLDESFLELPLKWKKPRKIFVASSGDLFHEKFGMGTICRVLEVMRAAPQHTYLMLTKRAQRMNEVLMGYLVNRLRKDVLPPNWWPGVSAEDEERARLRIPALVRIRARQRWISYEPALGPVNWAGIPGFDPFVSWMVIGGESGPGARPFDLDWARDTIAQSRAAGVPVFFKQAGSCPITPDSDDPRAREFVGNICNAGRRGPPYGIASWRLKLKSRKGSDLSELPEDLRVREWPREWPR